MGLIKAFIASLLLAGIVTFIPTAHAADPACGNAGHGWLPWPWAVYTGQSFVQRNHCGATRNSVGSKNHYFWNTYSYTPATSAICKNTIFVQTMYGPGGYTTTRPNWGTSLGTSWTPARSGICTGQSFTQTSNCNATRVTTGTKPVGGFTPSTSTVACGVSFTQTRQCGSARTNVGTAPSNDWAPAPSAICAGQSFTQTRSCGSSRTNVGTKPDSGWAPSVDSVCAGVEFQQVSACGNAVTAVGTKIGGICGATINDVDGDGIPNDDDDYPHQHATLCLP